MLLLTSTALAADVISYDATTVVEFGSGHPAITFHAGVDGSADVELDCGVKQYSEHYAMVAGADFVLPLTGLPEGSWQCDGLLSLETDEGATGQMSIALPVATLPRLTWDMGGLDLDLKLRRVAATASRPLAAAAVELIGIGGGVVDRADVSLADSSRPSFTWSSDAEVVKLILRGTDANGFIGVLELSPWSYEIPHDDVVFETGSDVITATDAPKLEATWTEVLDVMQKYGSVVVIQLYVAGYTDTVGDRASNQALSRRRARAIAEWFRTRGFPGTIFYQGFGEDGLAIQSGDEVDEARNRRAVYLLAAQPPPAGASFPRVGGWSSL